MKDTKFAPSIKPVGVKTEKKAPQKLKKGGKVMSPNMKPKKFM